MDVTDQLLDTLVAAQQEGNRQKVEELQHIRVSCVRLEMMMSELLSEVRAWRSLPLGGDH